jgi:hypothetical protein
MMASVGKKMVLACAEVDDGMLVVDESERDARGPRGHAEVHLGELEGFSICERLEPHRACCVIPGVGVATDPRTRIPPIVREKRGISNDDVFGKPLAAIESRWQQRIACESGVDLEKGEWLIGASGILSRVKDPKRRKLGGKNSLRDIVKAV